MPTQFTKDRPYITLNGFLYKVESYQYDDADYFVPPRREGLPKYVDFGPETVLAWRSWHHGFGNLYYEDAQSYYEAINTDASIQGQLTLSPLMASTARVGSTAIGEQIIQFPDFKGEQFAIGTNTVFYWMPSGSPNGWNVAIPAASLGGVTGKSANFTVLAPTASFAQGQYIYVPNASQYWAGTNASTWTRVGTMAAHFEAVGNRLWRGAYGSSGQWTISNSADGATWQTNAIFQLGNGVATMTWLMDYDDRLYMMSTQGLSSIDTLGNIADLAPEIGHYVDPRFGIRSNTFHGIAYIPSAQGLLTFNGSQIINPQTSQAMKSIGPDVNSWSQSEVRGKITGLAPYVNYMYATMQATGSSDVSNGYIVKFRDYPDIQPGQGWHPIAKFAGATMGAIKVSNLNWGGSTYPVLWTSAGGNIYQTRLPQDSDNPLIDVHMTYPPSGTFTLPIIDDQIPTFKKTWIQMVLDISNTPNTTIKVDASLDNAAFTNVATVTGSTGVFAYQFSASPTLSFSFNIVPRFTLSTTASNQTPVIRSMALHHLVAQPLKGQWHLKLAPEEHALPNTNQTSVTQLANLKAARKLMTLVPFQDWDGRNYSVSIIHYNPSWATREPGRGPQFLVDVILQDFGIENFYVDYAIVDYSYTV